MSKNSILGTLAKLLITQAAPVVIEKIAKSRLENEELEEQEDRIAALELRIHAIEQRNAKVEAEKVWETSMFRNVTIAVLAYLVIVAYLWFIQAGNLFTSAIVPAVGIFIITLLLPFIRDFWMNSIYKK